MPAGQPPYYKTPEDMQIAIDAYFRDIAIHNIENPDNIKHPTVTGLALGLGFCSRNSLLHYEERVNSLAQ